MPKVSVIIPVYGVEKYIERCARSLFEQTLDDMEFIFVDDCTPDCSIIILESIIEEYQDCIKEKRYKVRVVRMPTNSGQAAVRRHGIRLATGDYIIHCDSDDWVESNWAKYLYEKGIKDNLEVVICDYYRVINGRKQLCKNECVDGSENDYYIRKLLLKRCCTAVWNKLVKRTIFECNDFFYPKVSMWEDYVISTQVLYFSKHIGYLDLPLYNYYYNNQSICYNQIAEKKLNQVVENCNSIISFLKYHRVEYLYRKEIVVLKNNAKNEVLSCFRASNFYNLWYNTYSEINIKYLFNNLVSSKEKFRFVVVLSGLYPIWLKITQRAQK